MATMTEVAPSLKTSLADRVSMFLRDRGYDAATIARSRHDASAISPEDAASVQRIVAGPAPAPAPGPATVGCYEWSVEVLSDPHACPRLRSIAVALRNEDQIASARFVPPVMTAEETAERDERVALAAVAVGKAEVRPTWTGMGLMSHEARAIEAAVHDAWDAMPRGDTRSCAEVAETVGRLALKVVLDLRDRPEPPADPWDVESDPADWPADTDAHVWGLTDLDPPPTHEDLEWAAALFAATASLESGLIPADLPPIMGGAPTRPRSRTNRRKAQPNIDDASQVRHFGYC